MQTKNPWVFPSLILGIAIVAAVLIYKLVPTRTTPIPTTAPAPASEEFPSDLKVISYTEAPNYIGQEVIVEGTVVRIGSSKKGTLFLNFCLDYRKCPFYAVIFASNASLFPNIRRYEGKRVQIRGTIQTYRNQAEIILNNPAQIRLAE
ncbi:MAG: hypothetical protein V2G33_03290 [bacterium JZ-2024 1]